MVLGGFRSFHILVTTDLGKNLEIFQRRQKELKLQWRTKFLRQLTRSALIFPPFPLSPKQCCSLCTPVDFTLS